ncbi:MAG TPA: hypothetical protein VMV78_15380 [Thiobacillus sp.]|nr:hypothetical protein [Thiobacillus sp.]
MDDNPCFSQMADHGHVAHLAFAGEVRGRTGLADTGGDDAPVDAIKAAQPRARTGAAQPSRRRHPPPVSMSTGGLTQADAA